VIYSKNVFILLLGLLLATQTMAQRPLQGQGQGQFPQQQQQQGRERQQINPDQDEQGGRKKLIDDSTKMVFGPKTTLYFYQKDVKANRVQKYQVDTLLNNFHYYEPVAKSGWLYQDLGNIGSAAIPVFYDAPKTIGTTSGFHVYDLYGHSADSMKYYDTKSPYTNMSAFFGGGNRNMLDLAFARNVDYRWNLGFNFNTIRARKTLNPSARDDNLTDKNAYSFHTNYRSKNEKYFMLGTFSRTRHGVNEQGGIIPQDVDENSLLFAYEDAKVWLNRARAVDLRQEYHLYQEIQIVKGWQAYHVLDRRKQAVSFSGNFARGDSSYFNRFYPERFNTADSTYNSNHFANWSNEIGFKGDLGPIYYNAFVKYRTGRLSSPYMIEDFGFNEFYVGGALRGEINSSWRFEAEGEYLLPGAFRLYGLFVSPWLEASYTKALYKPTAMQTVYRGNHHRWVNDFQNTGVDQIKGVLKMDFKRWSFRPNVTINRVNNFVYFNQEKLPTQSSAEVFMLIPGVKSVFNIRGKFFWESEAYYSVLTGEGSDNFRIPEWVVNSRVYYDSPMFDENIFIQIGVSGRYRSDNFAYGYSPVIQQFHLQDNFNVYGYPVLDFFLNARINRTRLLFRMNHININTMAQEGYFVTPFYTGLKRFFDVGISWPLFD
jgi:hypothetical protein